MDESTEAEWKGAEKNFLHELDDLYAYTPASGCGDVSR